MWPAAPLPLSGVGSLRFGLNCLAWPFRRALWLFCLLLSSYVLDRHPQSPRSTRRDQCGVCEAKGARRVSNAQAGYWTLAFGFGNAKLGPGNGQRVYLALFARRPRDQGGVLCSLLTKKKKGLLGASSRGCFLPGSGHRH